MIRNTYYVIPYDICLMAIFFQYRLTEMDDTRGSGQGSGNENPQMTELRDMMQMLVGVRLLQ